MDGKAINRQYQLWGGLDMVYGTSHLLYLDE